MRTLKRFTLVVVATVLSLGAANAQNFGTIGLQAGYSQSSTTTEVPVIGKDTESISGFHVGPTASLSVQAPIGLEYGILYNYFTKTDKSENVNTVHALDIPVRVAFSYPVNDFRVFAFAGPNFNVGISNKVKSKAGTTTDIYDLDFNADGKKDLSRFDLQLGVGGGIEYKGIQVKVSYDWGMLNRSTVDKLTIKTNDLKVSLAYNL